jgi:hypothetical protein
LEEAGSAAQGAGRDDGRGHRRLRTALGEAAFVELTTMVAVENTRSRTNSALGLTSQGFKDRCEAERPIDH